MSYLGDFAVGTTFDFFFTTRRFTTGAPFTLAGTPVLSAYEDNSTTEITAGITLAADFDTKTGLNHVRIVASGANGYEAGKSYSVVITTGTVDSVSVVGEVVGYFTLERDATFLRVGAPAGASVSADIAAIEAQTDDIGAAGAGLTAVAIGTGGIAAASFAAGAIDAAAIAANAIGASELAADAVDEILDDTIGDGTLTVRQALRVLVAGMAAKLSGAATTTITIRNVADTADVIVATVDADGNRSATTVTP